MIIIGGWCQKVSPVRAGDRGLVQLLVVCIGLVEVVICPKSRGDGAFIFGFIGFPFSFWGIVWVL